LNWKGRQIDEKSDLTPRLFSPFDSEAESPPNKK